MKSLAFIGWICTVPFQAAGAIFDGIVGNTPEHMKIKVQTFKEFCEDHGIK